MNLNGLPKIRLATWGGLPRDAKLVLIEHALGEAAYREGFEEMIRENLGLVDAVVREVCRVRRFGRGHYSMRTILEFLRHHTAVNTGVDDFKVNNNCQRDLTTLVVLMFPELDGFFHTRNRRAA